MTCKIDKKKIKKKKNKNENDSEYFNIENYKIKNLQNTVVSKKPNVSWDRFVIPAV